MLNFACILIFGIMFFFVFEFEKFMKTFGVILLAVLFLVIISYKTGIFILTAIVIAIIIVE